MKLHITDTTELLSENKKEIELADCSIRLNVSREEAIAIIASLSIQLTTGNLNEHRLKSRDDDNNEVTIIVKYGWESWEKYYG